MAVYRDFLGVGRNDNLFRLQGLSYPHQVAVFLFLPKQKNRNKLLKTRLVFTSGGVEPVVESDGGNHSYFADKLIRVLRNNTGVIQSLNLFQSVKQYVIDNAPSQTPRYSSIHGTFHDGGEFLFFPKN